MDKIVVILVISSGLLGIGNCGKCPSTWLSRPGGTSCYKLWPNAKSTWDEAKDTCGLINADLLKFNSNEEKEWVIGEIKKYPANLEWWIGLKRHGSDETKWVWTDGETRNDSHKFITWGSGEPNNHLKSENCAEVWDSLLNDKNCDTRLQFICEQPIDTPRPCDMNNGWDDIYPGNQCYKLFANKITAVDALSLCTLNNATLLSVNGDTEQFIFSDFTTELNISTWINLKNQLDIDGSNTWQWLDSNKRELNSPYWLDGEPGAERIKNNSTFCATMSPVISRTKSFKSWEPAACDEQNMVICEKIPISCPPSFFRFTLSKCLMVAVSDSLLQWNEARGYCNLRGTSLMEIRSSYEMKELNKLMSSIVSEPSNRMNMKLWLGLTVNGLDGEWDTGTPIGEFERSMLKRGGAMNESGCAFLQFADQLEWKVGDCREPRVAACTIPGNTDVITPSRMKPRYVCPDIYDVIENTCIRRHYGDSMDWFSARDRCRQGGGDLATIHSSTKMSFLQDNALETMWLGLNDLQKEGSLFWSDEITDYGGEMGKGLETTNYVIGDRFSENCIAYINEAGTGKWSDVPCSFKNSFYCQTWAEWNIALGKNARQSSNYGDDRLASYSADKAIDGCTKQAHKDGCCTHTTTDSTPWWELDLGTVYPIRKVIIHRRYEEACYTCKKRMNGFRLFISNTTDSNANPVFQDARAEPPSQIIMVFPETHTGRYVRIDVPLKSVPLSLCEVQVFTDLLDTPKNENDGVLTAKNSDCYMDSTKWKGNVRHGISGRLCQEWVLNTPHEHTRHNDAAFPDGSQKEASNYCRDPDGEGRPWCYTVDPGVRWEYCPIPHCNTILPDTKSMMDVDGAADCGSSDWFEDGTGNCYRVNGPYTAADAQTFCEAAGGNLAIAYNEQELDFLVDMLTNQTADSLVWIGVSYSTKSQRWLTVDNSVLNETFVNSRINKLEIKKSIPYDTACIGIDTSIEDHDMSRWGFDSCLNRHHFICKKEAKYIKFFTPDETEVPIQQYSAISLAGKTTMLFEFRGNSGARIIMKNTAVESQVPLTVNIGYDGNSRSTVVLKYQSVNGFPAPIGDDRYSKFWISWPEGRIQIGEGDTIGKDVFLTGSLPEFAGFDHISLSVTGNDEGYWKFPRGIHDGNAKKNLALKKPTWQSSTYADISTSDNAVDGCMQNDYYSGCCMHTGNELKPWWEVDLGQIYNIGEIIITKRWDCESCRARMNNFNVHIQNTRISDSAITDDTIRYTRHDKEALPVVTLNTNGARGRYVLIQLPMQEVLSFCELEIYEDTNAGVCKSGWLSYDSHTCIYIGTTKVNWNAARDQCKDRDPDADLVVLKSAEQEMFIYENVAKALSPSENYTFWIGLKGMSNGKSLWLDDSSSTYSRLTSMPNQNKVGQDTCFMVGYDDTMNKGWAKEQCATPLYYICSISKVVIKTTTAIPTTPYTTKTTNPPTVTTRLPITTTIDGPVNTTTLMTSDQPNNDVCRNDWVYNKNTSSCYYVGRENGIDFLSAELECLKMQSRLGSITSEDENRFYKDLLYKSIKKNGKLEGNWAGHWIGGVDVVNEGSWKWFLYDEPWYDIQWNEGQPDNYNNGEDCVMLRSNGAIGEGNDAPCALQRQGYVCKQLISNYRCEEGWFYDVRTQNCYYVSQDVKAWSDARSTCQTTHQGDLASIVNKKEQEFIGVLTSDNKQDNQFYWVGAKTDPDDGTWWWSDKSRWWIRAAWKDGFQDPSKHCGAVTGTKSLLEKALLTNKNCKLNLPFICKKKAVNSNSPPNTNSTRNPAIMLTTTKTTTSTATTIPLSTSANKQCGHGWEKRPNSRYCYKVSTDVCTWMEANYTCNQSGGQLLSITTNEEQQYISGRLNGMRDLPLRMWIGAHDRVLEGKWTWTDGAPFAYFNWKITEPNDYENDEDCAAVITGKALYNGEFFGMWNDVSCDSPQGYICKKTAIEASTIAIPTVTTAKQEGMMYGCPGNGWLDYGSNSCYLFVQDKVAWDVASTTCRLQGADLASISSQMEQDFIFSQLPQDTYCFNTWANATECNLWAQRGECTRNPIWMATECHHACSLCLHHCRDLYASSEKCLEWASRGECDVNPAWMKINCAAGCGICKGAPTRGFWTGLYSDKGSKQYEWSDRTDVTYTNWDYTVKQPQYFDYVAGSCGAMFIQTGTWNDGPCSQILQGYVCEKSKQPLSTTVASPFKIGCSGEKSFGYESYCYTYVKVQKTFDDAQQYCIDQGGHLAYIKHRYVQSFLSSELVNQLQDYWIGLAFQQKILKWADMSDAQGLLTFTNFAKTLSLSDSGDICFAMTTFRPVGLWAEHTCNETLPFICQSLREGFTTPLPTTVAPDIPCNSGWKEYKGNCYLFVDDEVDWYDAKMRCSSEKATLASVANEEEQMFLGIHTLDRSWLGLHDTGDEGTFVWLDGMPVTFENWNDGEPNNKGNEDCAEFIGTGKWNDLPCDYVRPFCCKAPNGKQVHTTSIATVSTVSTTLLPTQNVCGDWRMFMDGCYKLLDDKSSWHGGEQMCLEHGGHLISIHSADEQNFINDMIRNTNDVVWAGFNDLDLDGVFKWTDGSVNDFTKWYPGQPNDGGGGEKCVAIDYSKHKGKWHDYPCRVYKYVLCKRPKETPVTPVTQVMPTTLRPGGCPPDFKEFGDKCYFIGGNGGWSTLKTWFDAQKVCRNKKAELTSIRSTAESGFITSLLDGRQVAGFWIGLNDLMLRNGRWDWADNSVVGFANWQENEPSSDGYDEELCVEMFNRMDRLGLWNNAPCSGKKGYICSAYKSVDYPPVQEDDDCTGGYKSYQGRCYKLSNASASWETTQSKCALDGGNLIAVTNVYEQAFVESLWNDDLGPLWVGMKIHRYGVNRWINGEAQTLPSLKLVLGNKTVGCLTLDPPDWGVDTCDKPHFGLCQINKVHSTSRTTPVEEKICSNRELFLYDGQCYFVSTRVASFDAAHTMCTERNMEFVSIHNYKEHNELANMVNETAVKSKTNVHRFFIGMYYETRRDNLPKWIDHSKVDYLQLPSMFYQLRNSMSIKSICFVFDTKTNDMGWNVASCTEPAGFICKMKADAPQTTVTTTTTTTEPTTTTTTATTTTTTTEATTTTTTARSTSETTHIPYKKRPNRVLSASRKNDSLSHNQVAAIVVGVIAFILLVIVVVYVLRSGYMRKYLYKVQDGPGLGFDNALYQKGEESQSESVKFD